jgi:hypothetical protein
MNYLHWLPEQTPLLPLRQTRREWLRPFAPSSSWRITPYPSQTPSCPSHLTRHAISTLSPEMKSLLPFVPAPINWPLAQVGHCTPLSGGFTRRSLSGSHPFSLLRSASGITCGPRLRWSSFQSQGRRTTLHPRPTAQSPFWSVPEKYLRRWWPHSLGQMWTPSDSFPLPSLVHGTSTLPLMLPPCSDIKQSPLFKQEGLEW